MSELSLKVLTDSFDSQVSHVLWLFFHIHLSKLRVLLQSLNAYFYMRLLIFQRKKHSFILRFLFLRTEYVDNLLNLLKYIALSFTFFLFLFVFFKFQVMLPYMFLFLRRYGRLKRIIIFCKISLRLSLWDYFTTVQMQLGHVLILLYVIESHESIWVFKHLPIWRLIIL